MIEEEVVAREVCRGTACFSFSMTATERGAIRCGGELNRGSVANFNVTCRVKQNGTGQR